MNCCSSSPQPTPGTGRFFSKRSGKYLKTFRRKGLAKEQRYLIEGISKRSLSGRSILEIGCGVGGLHLSLLQNGAGKASGIDLSEGMIRNARSLAQELSLTERTEYLQGDFVEHHAAVKSADIVILDKVVCCYEDVMSLVEKSTSKAGQMYALTCPKSNLLVKCMLSIPITLGTLLHWSFHPYWHDWDAMTASIEQSGFRPLYRNSTFFWAVHVFERR